MPRIDPKTIDRRPWWWHGSERHAAPEADPPAKVDVLVVGAGIAGLGAAALLAGRGRGVLVLDGRDAGDGVSSRTLGFAGAAPTLRWDQIARRFGARATQDMIVESGAAWRALEAVVADGAIDCDFAPTGRLLVAASDRQLKDLRRTVQELERAKVELAAVPPTRLAAVLPGGRYVGGVQMPGGTLDPHKLAQALLRQAREAGAEVSTRCGALSVETEGRAFRVETEVGSVLAGSVLVTAGAGVIHLPRRLAAPPGYRRTACFLATEPAPPDLLQAILPEALAIEAWYPSPRLFRLSADRRRLLFGGLPQGLFDTPEKAQERLARWLGEMFPALAQVRLAHAWTADLDFPLHGVPRLGGGRGLYHLSGLGWAEPAMALWLGRKLALRALGDEEGKSAFDATHRPKLLHRAVRPWLQPAEAMLAGLATRF
jgi:glycine/D-amino acid oxidase-like deaminating enzyme